MADDAGRRTGSEGVPLSAASGRSCYEWPALPKFKFWLLLGPPSFVSQRDLQPCFRRINSSLVLLQMGPNAPRVLCFYFCSLQILVLSVCWFSLGCVGCQRCDLLGVNRVVSSKSETTSLFAEVCFLVVSILPSSRCLKLFTLATVTFLLLASAGNIEMNPGLLTNKVKKLQAPTRGRNLIPSSN